MQLISTAGAMSQRLPYGNYQSDVDVKKYTTDFRMNTMKMTKTGHFLLLNLDELQYLPLSSSCGAYNCDERNAE